MSRKQKLVIKIQQASKTFPWSDLVALLQQLGYEKQEMAGSRVRFYNGETMLRLHRPHPENTIKGGALKAVKAFLKQEGYL